MRHMMTTLMVAGMTPVLAVGALAAGGSKLTVVESEKYGAYVAGSDGRALYMFTTDRKGEGDTAAQSSCYDACAEAWPPLLAEEAPDVGKQLDPEQLGTIQREDGERQVTYGGWPLYYFAKDRRAGSVTGQDVHGFGGEWYLVSPDGTKNEEEG